MLPRACFGISWFNGLISWQSTVTLSPSPSQGSIFPGKKKILFSLFSLTYSTCFEFEDKKYVFFNPLLDN